MPCHRDGANGSHPTEERLPRVLGLNGWSAICPCTFGQDSVEKILGAIVYIAVLQDKEWAGVVTRIEALFV